MFPTTCTTPLPQKRNNLYASLFIRESLKPNFYAACQQAVTPSLRRES